MNNIISNELFGIIIKEINKKPPDFNAIKDIFKNGININSRNNYDETFLMNAIEFIQELIWKDENGNWAETSDEAMELVQRMVPKIDVSIILILLEMGADPNIEDRDGRKCIDRAVVTFRSDIFKNLLDYNADLNYKYFKNEYFIDWIKDELHEFKNDGNEIAIKEISKMVNIINEKAQTSFNKQ